MAAPDVSRFLLPGQHVLITGAAGGIGLVTAQLFLEYGANVTLHYNRSLNNIKQLVQQYPNNTLLHSVPANNEQAIIESVQQATQKFGVINILICNHAISNDNELPIWHMSLPQWQQTIDINLTAYWLYAREYCRQLIEYTANLTVEQKQQGNACVLFVGSTAGKFGEACHMDYSAAKSALQHGILLSLKNEIVNIVPYARVNVVAPGWVATPMGEYAISTGKHLQALNTTPMKKVAQPVDIANALYFLAHPLLSGHITGQVLSVDGGMEGRVQNGFPLELQAPIQTQQSTVQSQQSVPTTGNTAVPVQTQPPVSNAAASVSSQQHSVPQATQSANNLSQLAEQSNAVAQNMQQSTQTPQSVQPVANTAVPTSTMQVQPQTQQTTTNSVASPALQAQVPTQQPVQQANTTLPNVQQQPI